MNFWKKALTFSAAGTVCCACSTGPGQSNPQGADLAPQAPRVNEARVKKPDSSGTALTRLGQAMEDKIVTNNELGKIEMSVVEADGTRKRREILFSRLNENGIHYTILRMMSPKDIKGTSLLSVIQNEQEEKWIFLPSSKQTRKITTSDSASARILDSELYGEDFDLGILKEATAKIVKEDADGTRVVETLMSNPKSSYSKTVAWVGKDNLLKKAEVYDKKNALLKEVLFTEYKLVGDGKYRAEKINISNLQNKRKTQLSFSGIKVNQNLKRNDFTPRSLAEGL